MELFVSGLPYSCNEEELKQFFGEEGILDIKMPKFQDSGRSLGYAHVVFDGKEEYERALGRNGETLGTRYLKIEPAKGKKTAQTSKSVSVPVVPVGCKTIFIKNLPYDATRDEIGQFCSSCGIVTDVRMVRNWANKNFKGFAYVDYREGGSVRKAIRNLGGSKLRGRAVVVDAVVTGHKKGFKRREPEEQEGNQQGN